MKKLVLGFAPDGTSTYLGDNTDRAFINALDILKKDPKFNITKVRHQTGEIIEGVLEVRDISQNIIKVTYRAEINSSLSKDHLFGENIKYYWGKIELQY